MLVILTLFALDLAMTSVTVPGFVYLLLVVVMFVSWGYAFRLS